MAPHLQKIDAHDSKILIKIRIDANYLEHYNFTNCPVKINSNIAESLGLSVAIFSTNRDHAFIQFCINISKNIFQKDSLNLSGKNINGLKLRAFSIALHNNTYITKLNLSNNKIKDDLLHLSYSLRENNSITLLNLSYNGITGNKFEQLCQAFATHSKLRIINFQHNPINSNHILTLAYYLKFACSEKRIYLDGNPAIETSAARELFQTFKQNENIKEITMRDVNSTDYSVRLLFEKLNRIRSEKSSRTMPINQNHSHSLSQIRIQIHAHGNVTLFSNQNKRNNKTENTTTQSSTNASRQLSCSAE